MTISSNATRFIDGVLNEIGAPINTTTVTGFHNWLANEQGGPGLTSFDANMGNPLGIQTSEAQLAGKTGNIAQGIASTAQLLKQNYAGIVSAFQNATSPTDIANAIVASPWNGSRYGGLAKFTSVANGQPVSSTSSVSQPLSSGVAPVTTPHVPTPGVLPNYLTQGMNQRYAGPGAYKGFDMRNIAGPEVDMTHKAIDAFTSQPGLEQSLLSKIFSEFPQDAWMASIPEVRTLLLTAEYNHMPVNQFQGALEQTTWWKQTSDSVRLYEQAVKVDPGQINGPSGAIAQAAARVTNVANALGVQLTQAQVSQISQTAAQQSIDQYGHYNESVLSQQTITEMVASHFNATQSLGLNAAAPGSPGAVTAAQPGGDAASLMNAFQTIARNYYLNLTPQQIAAYVQQAVSGDTGQSNFSSGAVSGFTTTAQNMAKTLYPALGAIIGTSTSVGTDNNPYTAMAPYRNTIAQYTGNRDPDSIDLTNPQWSWILSGKVPPSAAALGAGSTNSPSTSSTSSTSPSASSPVSMDQLQSYLMQQPAFQSTNTGKKMGMDIGSSVLKAFGYSG
jgi:hypothetical protein